MMRMMDRVRSVMRSEEAITCVNASVNLQYMLVYHV
jgi:hypothetical protein